MKVVVVGGGVIGLMTARELALAGCAVTVLERGVCGQEASWAGGGIVSPLYPWRYSEPVTRLTEAAQAIYPHLAAELLAETGIDAELDTCGLLMLDAEDADTAVQWAAAHHRPLEVLAHDQLHQRFPRLAPHWQQGLWMSYLASIRNPRLLKALLASLQQKGVVVHEQQTVVGLERTGDRVTAVNTQAGLRVTADHVVLCAGAWTASLLTDCGVASPTLPVQPVRGQMILYKRPAGELPCMILGEGKYVIPRRDGHVLCGSTLEETGFDKSTTPAAKAELMAVAARLWPVLAGETPVAHWAGLRPSSPDGVPFISAVAPSANLWVQAGHYRNGLLLAPSSARLMADLLLGREPSLDPAPYRWV